MEDYVFRPFARPLSPEQVYLRRFVGQVFAIEGNIGAGKSTLGRDLVSYLVKHGIQATFFPETFPEALLNEFIVFSSVHPEAKNPHAFALQMAILECRLETYQKALELSRAGHSVVIDRSLPGDYVFARLNAEIGNIDPSEWQAYKARVEHIDVLAPTAIIYLDASVSTCKRRIDYRGRASEDKYTDDYLERLASTYNEVLKTLAHPLLRVAWDTERRDASETERNEMSRFIFRALDALMSISAMDHEVAINI